MTVPSFLDMDRFWDASIELSMALAGLGLFVLTALTSAGRGHRKWKYPPIIVGALVLGLLRYLAIVPSWPEVSVVSLATFLLLSLLTCCLIVDYRFLFKWMRGRNRLSYNAVLCAMNLIVALLLASWIIHVQGTVSVLRMERQAERILHRSLHRMP